LRRKRISKQTIRLAIAAMSFGLPLGACTSTSSVPPLGEGEPLQAQFRRAEPALSARGFSILHTFNYEFNGAGVSPNGVALDAGGNIFGTTAGQSSVLFELSPDKGIYVDRVLHVFSCPTDGCEPQDAPLLDPVTGDAFVSNFSGGTSGFGTVVKLSPGDLTYTETGLFTFTPGFGGNPYAKPLLLNGTLYVTSPCCSESSEGGTIVALTSDGLQPTVLYNFTDGGAPGSSLVPDATGALYGTAADDGTGGNGVVYRFVPSVSGGTVSIVYAFKGGSDGSNPFGAVLIDATGSMYGVTNQGGPSGDGIVYKLTPSGSGYVETVLHAFKGPDGAHPYGALVMNGKYLWGTTDSGGDKICACGTLFSLSPSGSHFKVRHTFVGSDGSEPFASLAVYDRALYGTTLYGGPGPSAAGVVFRYKP
jgi:uncharacterized repeat protein (TIGR03803 family)